MAGAERAHRARKRRRLSGFRDYAAEQAAAWGSAPWERVAEGNSATYDALVERLQPAVGKRWLDVATGTGAVAIRAARAGAEVVGLDLAPKLIETARRLAAEEGLEVEFEVGDAQALPYGEAEFDVVSSSFGVIFAPDQGTAAGELARVCRAGGRLGLTTLHQDSSGAEMFRHLWRYRPLPPGAGDPLAWGDAAHLRSLLEPAFELEVEVLDAPPHEETAPARVWEFMVSSMGMFRSVYESLDRDGRAAFKDEYLALLERGPGPRRHVRVLGSRR